MGKVIQSTAEYTTDSLTLLVNLDDKGQATGMLYVDAGDGYGYKHGEYALYRFTATMKAGRVDVKKELVDGKPLHQDALKFDVQVL